MRVNSMKVLVTGGAGFMGSYIAERLIEMGFEKESIYIKNPLKHSKLLPKQIPQKQRRS